MFLGIICDICLDVVWKKYGEGEWGCNGFVWEVNLIIKVRRCNFGRSVVKEIIRRGRSLDIF